MFSMTTIMTSVWGSSTSTPANSLVSWLAPRMHHMTWAAWIEPWASCLSQIQIELPLGSHILPPSCEAMFQLKVIFASHKVEKPSRLRYSCNHKWRGRVSTAFTEELGARLETHISKQATEARAFSLRASIRKMNTVWLSDDWLSRRQGLRKINHMAIDEVPEGWQEPPKAACKNPLFSLPDMQTSSQQHQDRHHN